MVFYFDFCENEGCWSDVIIVWKNIYEGWEDQKRVEDISLRVIL